MWDNFHYMDDEEAYWVAREFATAEEAVAHAREIVYRSCADVEFDLSTYLGFGEDPLVIGPPGVPRVEFSARRYAAEVCRRPPEPDSPRP